MSDLVHFEYPPPRSWEQFEELCADLFENMWRDPGLIRHGRSGQRQFGVDIVATNAGAYPIGLQCKKKSRWPVSKLQKKDIDKEVQEAQNFNPTLKEFYILTTALADAKIEEHVRQLDSSSQFSFKIKVIFWSELVRKVALFENVARKHFPQNSGKYAFSPLLVNWRVSDGKIQLTPKEFQLSVSELREDFYRWPTGHISIRQQESDALQLVIHSKSNLSKTHKLRNEMVKLRRNLRELEEREQQTQEAVLFILKTDKLRFYVFDLDETGKTAYEVLKTIVERKLDMNLRSNGEIEVRFRPPDSNMGKRIFKKDSIALTHITVNIDKQECSEILKIESEFPSKHHGNPIPKVISELPNTIRSRHALPAIISRLQRIMEEDRISVAQLEDCGYLDIHSWHYAFH